MRLVMLGVSVLCLAAPIAMFACSTTTSTTEADQTADSGSTPALPDEGQQPAADPTPAPAVDPDAAAAPVDAAPTGVSTEGDAGVRCQTDSLREVEGNNDLATANVVPGQTLTYCGRLTQGDVDVVKFTMPQQVNNFFFNIEAGNVRVQPSLDGQDFSFNSNDYPFKPGGVYALKISSNNANADYRIKITINL